MRTIYIWDEEAQKVVPKGEETPVKRLQVIPELKEYHSPLSFKMVTNRRQRREEMKVHNVREVEPSEFKAVYRNERFAKKHGLPFHEGD